jgi:hypothetical protein
MIGFWKGLWPRAFSGLRSVGSRATGVGKAESTADSPPLLSLRDILSPGERGFVVCILIAIALLVPQSIHAQQPELHTLVPPGAGLYVEVHEVGASWEAFTNSPLGERIEAYPPIAQWRRENLPGLLFIARTIVGQLGVEARDVTDELLRGSAAVAVWPERPDAEAKTTSAEWQGVGLVLVRIDDAALLQKAFVGLNRLTKRTGDLLSLDEHQHAGFNYHRRHVRRDGREQDEYWAIVEGTVAVTDHEGLIKRYLEGQRRRADGTVGPSTLSPEALALWNRLDRTAMLRGVVVAGPWRDWLEPRKNALQQSGEDPRGIEALLTSGDAAVVSLSIGPELSAEVFVGLTPQHWPEPLQDWWREARLDETETINRLLTPMPADALLVMYGRFDVSAALTTAYRMTDANGQRDVKRMNAALSGISGIEDPHQTLLPALGPGLVVSVTAPVLGSPDLLPDVMARFPWSETNDGESVHNALADTLGWAWRSAAVVANLERSLEKVEASPVRVVESTSGEEAATLVGFSPDFRWLEPAYLLTRDSVVLGNSARAVAQSETTPPEPLVDTLTSDNRPTSASPIWVRVNLSACRDYLEEHAPELATMIAESRNVPVDRAERALDQLQGVINLADEIVLNSDVHDDTARIGLTIRAE